MRRPNRWRPYLTTSGSLSPRSMKGHHTTYQRRIEASKSERNWGKEEGAKDTYPVVEQCVKESSAKVVVPLQGLWCIGDVGPPKSMRKLVFEKWHQNGSEEVKMLVDPELQKKNC